MTEQMVMGTEAFECGIKKSLINAGKTKVDYVDGTKVSWGSFYLIILNLNYLI